MGLLNSLFGAGLKTEKIDFLIKKGAVIMDVRSPDEFQSGHIQGSRNVPLNQIKSQIPNLKEQNKPVICCCASGNRSGMAVQILRANGIEAENGGGWKKLERILT